MMKKAIVICLCVFSALGSQAQNNLTLYNMKTIPQRFLTNPARPSDAKIFIGVPGLSSGYLDFGITTFKIKDVLNAIESDGQGNSVLVFKSQLMRH